MNPPTKLLGYYNYTVVLTYIGMLCGFCGIVYVLEQNAVLAMVCLMLAGFCDMFDGAVASTKVRTQQEKCFGIQIDSLSDLICFGVLPAIFVYRFYGIHPVVLGISALYVLCALIRLAYFNVDEQERQQRSNTGRELYFGMPVTLSALFLPLVYCLSALFCCSAAVLCPLLLMLMAAAFLIPIPLKKPKLIGKLCVIVCGILDVCLLVLACLEG